MLIWATLLTASAAEPHPEVPVGGPHEGAHEGSHHNTWFAGAKGMALRAVEGEESFTHTGGGLFVEHLLTKHFEVEIAVHGMTAHEGMIFPIDVLAKGAAHLTPAFEPYAGAGPSLVVPSNSEHEPTRYGVACVAGANMWMAPHLGVFAEPNVNLLWGGEKMLPEVGGVSGLIVGW